MPLSFLLDLLTAALCALALRSHGEALLLLSCLVQLRYEAAILLGRRLFVPSWARLLKYCAVCTALSALFSGASLMRALCAALGLSSLAFVDRAALPDPRVTLWALAPTAIYAAVSAVRYPERALLLLPAWGIAYAVYRLTLRFGEQRDAVDAEPEASAWTADGYCKDQDALGAYRYRSIPACHNGCGPVAAYNLRRFSGQDARLADVLAELDALHPLRVPGPTHHRVMRRYLRRYLPDAREARGRDAAVAAASKSRMGVFRYLEQRVPHYVAYVRVSGGFRFFNVCDDLEDAVLPMERFASEHLLGGSVKLIWWE